jgi:hypothetical protein
MSENCYPKDTCAIIKIQRWWRNLDNGNASLYGNFDRTEDRFFNSSESETTGEVESESADETTGEVETANEVETTGEVESESVGESETTGEVESESVGESETEGESESESESESETADESETAGESESLDDATIIDKYVDECVYFLLNILNPMNIIRYFFS